MASTPGINSEDAQSRIPAIIITPLRLFLGLIFTFAGIDKLTDPTFLDPSNGNYIGRQLQGFVTYNHSPLSFLLTGLAIPNARLFGIMISITELVVGVLVILGLFTRAAALVGLLLQTTLWLTASWGQQPFYTGWDLPYVFAWLTLLLAGAGPLSLDYRLSKQRGKDVLPVSEERRHLLMRGGALVGALIAVAVGGGVALTGLFNRLQSQPASTGTGSNGGTGGANTQPAPSATPTAGAQSSNMGQGDDYGNSGSSIGPESTPPGGATDTPIPNPTPIPAGGVAIAKTSDIAAGSGYHFINPNTQDDAWLIHLPDGNFVAFSAVCTHQGCSVNFDPSQELFICPCHGSEYDPTNNAAVVHPPAPKPLSKLQIRVDQASGNIYYVNGG